ncbi:tRNA (adenosine(37)-N6)-threonylcarbamoyltransferase complex ATPase subunit type 1 TsaE [Filifactor villosus]|uniref:tRNA threonylcarbamoyladenosine biosynthesis protein TsaE n=1 Tax=Filifactor villosus TaxID=29374 RepID=A0ABV9QM98_9FIRM
MNISKLLRNEEETLEFGRMIGKNMEEGILVCLNGDLGAGKTCLTKGIAQGLEIEEDVTSPTFILVEEYEGRLPLYHFDVYRIDDPEELYFIGFEEYLGKEAVVIIEWSSRIEEILPIERLDIDISRTGEDEREITLSAVGETAQALLRRLKQTCSAQE